MNKQLLPVLWVVLVCILAYFVIIGYDSAFYDSRDKALGKKFRFNVATVLLTDFPDNYAGKYVSEKYNKYINEERSWENRSRTLSEVGVVKIRMDEDFTIKAALVIQRHGILNSMTTPPTYFYIVESERHGVAVIRRSLYENHAAISIN